MQWRVRALCEPWPSTIVRMIDIVESVPASDCSSKPICSGKKAVTVVGLEWRLAHACAP